MARVIQDQQILFNSSLCYYRLNGVQFLASYRDGLSDWLVQSVGVASFDAALSADHNIEQCTGNNGLL